MSKINPIPSSHKRQWLRCKTCGDVAYYDFVPYSFSNPIMTMPCGHGAVERNLGAEEISADAALAKLAKAGDQK